MSALKQTRRAPYLLLAFLVVSAIGIGVTLFGKPSDTAPIPFSAPEPDIQRMIGFISALTPFSGQPALIEDTARRLQTAGYELKSDKNSSGNRIQIWEKGAFDVQLGTCTKSDNLVYRHIFSINNASGPVPEDFAGRVLAQLENTDLIRFDDAVKQLYDRPPERRISLYAPTLYERTLQPDVPGQISKYSGLVVLFPPDADVIAQVQISYTTACP